MPLAALRFVQGFSVGGEWGGSFYVASKQQRAISRSDPLMGVNFMSVKICAALPTPSAISIKRTLRSPGDQCDFSGEIDS